MKSIEYWDRAKDDESLRKLLYISPGGVAYHFFSGQHVGEADIQKLHFFTVDGVKYAHESSSPVIPLMIREHERHQDFIKAEEAKAKLRAQAEEYETVEHPKHYNNIPGVECIDVVEHMNFNLGNAVKYVWRCGSKPGVDAIEDLQKARFYIEREIDRLSK